MNKTNKMEFSGERNGEIGMKRFSHATVHSGPLIFIFISFFVYLNFTFSPLFESF